MEIIPFFVSSYCVRQSWLFTYFFCCDSFYPHPRLSISEKKINIAFRMIFWRNLICILLFFLINWKIFTYYMDSKMKLIRIKLSPSIFFSNIYKFLFFFVVLLPPKVTSHSWTIYIIDTQMMNELYFFLSGGFYYVLSSKSTL